MNKKYLSLIIILVIIIGFFVYRGLSGNSIVSAESGELAKCLTEKGIIMYGTGWCSFCQKQKDSFGDSFKYITFVDCDKNKEACLAAGVRGYPTWKINGENYPGLKSLRELSELANC